MKKSWTVNCIPQRKTWVSWVNETIVFKPDKNIDKSLIYHASTINKCVISDDAGDIFDYGTGSKDRCSVFNDMQITCEAGICQNYSAVYK